ncbi:MAG: hypothetical protein ABJB78_09130 [Betaproteobacteria bacterium]
MNVVRPGAFRTLGAAAVFAWTALARAALATAAPVALVTDVVGTATQRGAPLRLLAELEPGSEVSVADGGRVVVFYLADGAEWTLAGRGQFRLAPRAPRPQHGAPAPQRQPVATPLAGVRLRTDRAVQGGFQMRGGSDRAALGAPVDEALLDGDVEFSWEPAGAGTLYRFELVDAAGSRIHLVETRERALRLPAGVALAPGTAYVWAVSGRDPDLPQPFYRAAGFRVADAATRTRLRAARPPADAPFAERALYVAVLEDAGVKAAARALRTALAAERTAGWAPAR